MDAAEYDRCLYEPWSRELIQRAKVWKGDRVLDVACRTGVVACRIAGMGAKVTAVDANAAMIEQARQRAADEAVPVTWVTGELLAVRAKAAAFDLVTCQQGLQLATDRAAMLREMRRVLAPGGRAVIACWAGPTMLDAIARTHFEPDARTHSLGDRAELTKLLMAAKFFAIAIDSVKRIVRVADPARFAALAMRELASAAADEAALTVAIEETAAMLQSHAVDGTVELATESLVAVARVPA